MFGLRRRDDWRTFAVQEAWETSVTGGPLHQQLQLPVTLVMIGGGGGVPGAGAYAAGDHDGGQ
jgi:hypothetical protein